MIVIVVFLSLEVYLENLHDVFNCLIKNEQTKTLSYILRVLILFQNSALKLFQILCNLFFFFSFFFLHLFYLFIQYQKWPI